jgi:hypothetical protein
VQHSVFSGLRLLFTSSGGNINVFKHFFASSFNHSQGVTIFRLLRSFMIRAISPLHYLFSRSHNRLPGSYYVYQMVLAKEISGKAIVRIKFEVMNVFLIIEMCGVSLDKRLDRFTDS